MSPDAPRGTRTVRPRFDSRRTGSAPLRSSRTTLPRPPRFTGSAAAAPISCGRPEDAALPVAPYGHRAGDRGALDHADVDHRDGTGSGVHFDRRRARGNHAPPEGSPVHLEVVRAGPRDVEHVLPAPVGDGGEAIEPQQHALARFTCCLEEHPAAHHRRIVLPVQRDVRRRAVGEGEREDGVPFHDRSRADRSVGASPDRVAPGKRCAAGGRQPDKEAVEAGVAERPARARRAFRGSSPTSFPALRSSTRWCARLNRCR